MTYTGFNDPCNRVGSKMPSLFHNSHNRFSNVAIQILHELAVTKERKIMYELEVKEINETFNGKCIVGPDKISVLLSYCQPVIMLIRLCFVHNCIPSSSASVFSACGNSRNRRMFKAAQLVSSRSVRQFHSCYYSNFTSCKFPTRTATTASRKNDLTLVSRKGPRNTRRLITISTAGGKWPGNWTCDYLLSLQDLHLDDLIEDEERDALLSINLCIQKHASFGLSVDGRIVTSFTRKCSICASPYCRQIDTNFSVLVLPSSRNNPEIELPEIGGDDPSVIYVKPGHEADLDSLVQDTVRLTTSTKDTCSETCENSERTTQCVGFAKQNSASIDKRWSRLLELKNTPSRQ